MKRLYKMNLIFWLAMVSYILIIVPFNPSFQKVFVATLISVFFLICHLFMAWKFEIQKKYRKQRILKESSIILLLEIIVLVIYWACIKIF